MRPLLVLVLVLVALAALVFGLVVMRGGSTKDDVAVRPAAAPTQPTKGAKPVDLATPAEATRTATAEPELPAAQEETAAVTSAPGRQNSLVGSVVNDKGAPVSGANVQLSRDPMMGEQITMAWFMNKEPSNESIAVKTDGKGQYKFAGVEPGRDYFLLASHPDYSQAQEEQVFVGDTGEFRGPDIVVRPGSYLSGFVLDINGNTVPNASLHLDSAYMMGTDPKSPDRLTVTSDGQGFYEFKNIASGPRNLAVVADGFGVQVRHNLMFKGEPDDRQEAQFRLEPGLPMAGRVLGPDNMGIAEAKVMALNYGNNTSSRGEAVSGPDGAFQIDGLQSGSYILMVEAKGFRQGRMNRVQAGDMSLVIEMIKKACVTGQVVDASTGAPLASFTCSVRSTGLDPANPQNAGVTPVFENTGIKESFEAPTGNFELCGLEPGYFAVQVTSSGYAPSLSEIFAVKEGQPLPTLAMRMSLGGSLVGRVVDPSGAAVAGAQVSSHDNEIDPGMSNFLGGIVSSRVTERKTRTKADGSFELKLLNPGTYRIEVDHPSFTREMVRSVEILEGKPKDIGTVGLKMGGTIKGKVLDQAGRPLARGFVHLRDETDDFSFQARTDAEGRYTIEHVPAGTFMLSATRGSPSGGEAFDAILDQQVSEVSISVADGTTVTRDLNLGN